MDVSSPLGRITVAPAAIAQIVGHTIDECYGVVGLGGRRLAAGRRAQAISVDQGPEGLSVGLRVVVEHGLNLSEVASTLRSRVAYDVERLTGLPVASVDVHIDSVRAK
jgi:uncharacterized alkaline shock family protein YloU